MATLATVVYGLLSVPLALHFLSVEEFGLFMLLIQIAGYFSLVELGMAGAAARILIDHKDNQISGLYGTLILTGSIIFTIQGLAVLLAGTLGASWLVSVAGVPPALQGSAAYLLAWLSASFAIGTVFRMLGAVLYANQRLDILNLITAIGVLLALLTMALILVSGGTLESLATVFVLQVVLTILTQAFACWWLKLLPQKGCWGAPSLRCFFKLFQFAKDIFLINVGNQLLEGSQLIIVTKTMGLTAAAVWSVSTKLFNLFYQLLTRIEGTAVVFFSEMIVRGETARLRERFRQIYQLTAGLAVVALAFGVATNRAFVSVWAEPSLAWGSSLNLLLAMLVFLNVLSRCFVDLLIHSKQLQALRYVYFIEALAFVVMAILLAPSVGFYGILVSALVCLALVRLWYTCWRVARYFDMPVVTFYWHWLKPALAAALLLAPFVFLAEFLGAQLAQPLAGLLATVICVGIPCGAILISVALPKDVVRDAATALSGQMTSVLRKAGLVVRGA